MGVADFLVLLAIAGICGFFASKLMGAKRVNIVLMVVLGFVGAAVGQWIAGYFGLPLVLPLAIGPKMFPLLWAFIGSVVVIGIVSAIQQH